MPQDLPITEEGYNKLLEELEDLKKNKRPNVVKAIAEARAHGDLSENAEYHAAKERQSHIETRIGYLEDRLARSQIVKINTADSETIVFGCTVKVQDMADGFEEEYTLVGGAEADPAGGKISTVSPIGKALIGKRVDDVLEVETPGGILRLKVLAFS